jgi:TIGR03009 family protein
MLRSRTIWIAPLVALVSLGFGLVFAQTGGGARQPSRGQPAAGEPQPPKMTMPQLLVLWEGQSAKLQTLELDMYRIDKDPNWGDEEHYLAHAAFKTPQLAFLDFRKVKMKEQPDPKDKRKKQHVPVKNGNDFVSVPYETIVCTGEEVWQYRYGEERKIYIYPLDKDQRKRALEEGPLPFLFNMRAAEAKKRYAMYLKGEDKTRYLVMIKPLLQADQDTFSTAWIYLHKESLLPTRVCLVAPDGQSTKDFWMSRIAANKPVKEIYFQGIAPKNFKIIRNPGGSDVQVKARGRRRQPPNQDARRPADAGAQTPR